MQILLYALLGVLALIGAAIVLVAALYLWSWIAAPFIARSTFASIAKHFGGFLRAGNLRCTERAYHWKAFGNFTVLYDGPTFFLHIYRDRLDWIFNFGCRGTRPVEYDDQALFPTLGICDAADLSTRKQYEPAHVGDLASQNATHILKHLERAAAGPDPVRAFID